MGERENRRRAVDRLAVRRMETIRKNGGNTTFERERGEALKVAREVDASDADRRRSMASAENAKRQKADAVAEARERSRSRKEPDTSSRPGESKQAWLSRMREQHKKG